MSDRTRGDGVDDVASPSIPGFRPVGRVDELEPGVPFAVEAEGLRVCLARIGDDVVAFDDQCTHREYPLSAGEILPDGTIECPWHGARFDCRTGAVRQGPASRALPMYEVRIVDGIVHVKVRP